ncbi:MAG TPA: TetR family transcriptional regulator [Ktedonobacteraceae bacterium]
MRRTKEDAALTREKLLDAALESFHARGYIATTLDDIARQAGTTRGAIAWHFGSKAELLNTVIRERYVRAAAGMLAIQAQGGSPLQILRRVLLHWTTYIEEDPEFRAIHEITLQTPISRELAEGMQERVEGIRRSVAYFAGLIQRGIDAGEIRPEINPEVAATAALGMTNGVSMIWLLDPTAFSLKAHAEEMVGLLIDGLAQPAP